MIAQVISSYHLISMRSHQHIVLRNTLNHLFLPVISGSFLIAALLVEHLFPMRKIQKHAHCFGPSLQKWIKAVYCDISSAVTNNGHVSEFFSLQADAILKSTFKSVMGRQFLRKCFGMHVINP
jgi:hypothetical protein